MNVSHTKYPVVKFVGKKIFGFRLNYEAESMDWDLYWTDGTVSTEILCKMKPF